MKTEAEKLTDELHKVQKEEDALRERKRKVIAERDRLLTAEHVAALAGGLSDAELDAIVSLRTQRAAAKKKGAK